MAARASWTGTIGFGLVSMQVGTTPAVKEQGVAFKQFQEVATGKGKTAKTEMHPVGRKDFNKTTGEVIEFADIVKGYEASTGAVVKVDPDELEALKPEATKHIGIDVFVEPDEVDFLQLDRHEWLMPRKGSEKAYAVLQSVLAETGKIGVGTTVRNNKERRVVLREHKGALLLSFLHWGDEVRSPVELDLPAMPEPNPAEVNMGIALVQALSGEFDPDVQDEYRNKVVELLEAKAKGAPLPTGPVPDKGDNATDLMAALSASVEKAKAAK